MVGPSANGRRTTVGTETRCRLAGWGHPLWDNGYRVVLRWLLRDTTRPLRGSVQVLTQPFAYLVNILSRRFANDCRSLLVKAGGPPVYIPLARNVSMKSRMLSR